MKAAIILSVVIAVLTIFVVSSVSATIQSSDGQRDFADSSSDVEARMLARLELANLARLLRAARISSFGNSFGGIPSSLNKRNSELINSLLGLPKVMSDAGK